MAVARISVVSLPVMAQAAAEEERMNVVDS